MPQHRALEEIRKENEIRNGITPLYLRSIERWDLKQQDKRKLKVKSSFSKAREPRCKATFKVTRAEVTVEFVIFL
jgi:hypothetical protein